MPNRREFLQSAIASLACTPLLSQAQEREQKQVPVDINQTLQKIAQVLRTCPDVALVEEHFIDSPAKGLVHWSWMHYRYDIQNYEIPRLERVNKELLSAMQTARTIPHSGLDTLRMEGLIEGKVAQQIENYRNDLRTLIKLQITVPITFGLWLDIQPTQEIIDREMNVVDNLYKPILQTAGPDDNPKTSRFVCMSPLARLGAGYVFSMLHGTKLFPAEDSYIDSRAAMAEHSRLESVKSYWVLHQRNTHAVKLVRESDQDIENLLMGAGHRLRSYIEASNDQYKKKMSSLRVTVKSLKRM